MPDKLTAAQAELARKFSFLYDDIPDSTEPPAEDLAKKFAFLYENDPPEEPPVVSPLGDIAERAAVAPHPLPPNGPDTLSQIQRALNPTTKDEPKPRNMAQAVRQWGARGVFFAPRDHALGPQIDPLAEAYAGVALQKMGLWNPITGNVRDMDDTLYQDLVGAVRGELAYSYRSLTDEERPVVQRRIMRNFMQQAEKTAQFRLQRLHAQGRGTRNTAGIPKEGPGSLADPEVIRWQGLAAKARMLSNSVDDPEFRDAFMNLGKQTLVNARNSEAKADVQGRRELGITSHLFDLADFERKNFDRVRPDVRNMSQFSRRQALVEDVFGVLKDVGNPAAQAEFVRKSFLGAIQETRNEAHGLSPEISKELGTVRALAFNHPELYLRLISAAQQNEMRLAVGDNVLDGEARFHKKFKKQREQSLRMAMERFVNMAATTGNPAAQATGIEFKPEATSTPEAIATAGEAGLQTLGVGLRAGFDFLRQTFFGAEQKILKATAKIAGEDLPELQSRVENFSIEEAIADPNRAVTLKATPPHLIALATDAKDGQLSWGTMGSIMNPGGDPLAYLAILNSPTLVDVARRTLLDAGRKDVSIETAKEWWLLAKQEAMDEAEATIGGTPPPKPLSQIAAQRQLRAQKPFSRIAQLTKQQRTPRETLGTRERRKKAIGEYSAAMRSVDSMEDVIKVGTKMYAWAIEEAVGEARDMYQLIRTDPNEALAITAIGMVFGQAGNMAGRKLSSVLRNVDASVQNVLRTRKLKTSLRNTMAADAPAGRRMVNEMKKMKIENPGQLTEALDATLDASESILDHHVKNTEAALLGAETPNPRHLTESVARFKNTIKPIDQGTTLRLLNSGGVEQGIFSRELMEQTFSLLPELVGALKDKLGFWGTTIPAWTAKNAPRAFSAFQDAFQSGALNELSLDSFQSLFSAPAAHKIKGKARVVDRLLPDRLRRQLDIDNKIAGTPTYLKDVFDVFANAHKDLEAFRIVASDKRTLADSFLTMSAKSHRRNGRVGLAESAERALKQGRDVSMDQGVPYDKHPAIQSATVPQIAAWTAANESPGRTLFHTMKFARESKTQFYERITSLQGEALGKFKEKWAREWINAPDIRKTFNVDSFGKGQPITPSQAKTLRAERGAIRDGIVRKTQLERDLNGVNEAETAGRLTAAEAALDRGRLTKRIAKQDRRIDRLRRASTTEEYMKAVRDDPDLAGIGVTKKNLNEVWNKIDTYAATERTDELLGIAQRAQDIDSGDPNVAMNAMRSAHFENKLNIQALLQRGERTAARIAAQPEAVRDAFHAAIRAQEELGDFATMAELRKTRPDLFDGLIFSGDEALDHALKFDKKLRGTVGLVLLQSGVIDEGEFKKFLKPFSPRQYRAFFDRKIIGTAQKSSDPKGSTAGMLGEELEMRREIKDYRLIVRARNGSPEELTFPTREAAEQHVLDNFGIQEGKIKRGRDTTGTTATGDTFHILEPVGQADADALSIVPAGGSLTDRWFSLAKLASVARTADMLDRPGLSFTPDEFLEFRQTPNGIATGNQYITLDPASRKYGKLRGKKVHERVKAFLDDAEEMADTLRTVQELSSAALGNRDRFIRGITRFGNKAMLGLPGFFKNAIVANGIFRNPSTHFTNLISDHFIFGRLATDSGWHFSKTARVASKDAFDFIFGGEEAFAAFIKNNPKGQLAIDMGILDETLAGPFLQGKSRKAVRILTFGTDTTSDPYRRFVTDAFGDPDLNARRLSGDDLSQAKRNVQDRFDELEQMQADPVRWGELKRSTQEALLDEMDNKRAFLKKEVTPSVQKSFGDAVDFLSWVTQGKHVGKSGLGPFGDVTSLSADLYQRISNFNRVKAFFYNIDRGMSPEMSRINVNRFMQTYSNVPKALRTFSKSPLGVPILSFTHELMRIGGNALIHQPGLLAGMASALPMMNMFAMGAAGIDPDTVMANLRREAGGLSTWTVFFGGVLIPKGDGTFGWAGTQWADFFQLVRAAPGMRDPQQPPEEDEGVVQFAGRAALNLLGKVTLNNPVLNAGQALLTNRDVRSGRKFQSTAESMLENGKNLGKTLIPPLTPIVGRISQDIYETAVKPSNLRSGRVESVAERWIQANTGIRLRGFAPELEFLNPLAKGALALAGDSRAFERPLRGSGGFTDRDLLANLLIASRKHTAGNPAGEFETFIDHDARKFRSATEQIKLGDTKEGKRRRREAIDAISTKLRLRGGRGTDVEIRKDIEALAESDDLDLSISRATLAQKAWMLVQTSQAAKDEGTVETLADMIVFPPSGVLRSATVPQINEAKFILNKYLRDLPADAKAAEAVQSVLSHIETIEAGALVDDERERIVNPTAAAAAAMLQEL